jgi:RNA recognition motif-containing protein
LKIYVGNLSYSTSSEGLREAFEEFGTVDSAEVVMDRNTNRSRGFGFVEMSNGEEAQAAITALNGKDVDGRPLNVSEARPKRTESRSSYRY